MERPEEPLNKSFVQIVENLTSRARALEAFDCVFRLRIKQSNPATFTDWIFFFKKPFQVGVPADFRRDQLDEVSLSFELEEQELWKLLEGEGTLQTLHNSQRLQASGEIEKAPVLTEVFRVFDTVSTEFDTEF